MIDCAENKEDVIEARPWSLKESMLLYAVTDNAWLAGRRLEDCVAQALCGGVTFVQLRDKQASTEELVHQAKTIIPLCREAGVPFVINDDVEAARLSGADGVHVGQSDEACEDARVALGADAIVGVSVQTVDQALTAQAAGASYLGVGAVFSTSTKADAAEVSLTTLTEICEAVDIPVVAIGGIDEKTLPELAESGIDGVALVSAIFAAEDIEQTSRRLAELSHLVIGS